MQESSIPAARVVVLASDLACFDRCGSLGCKRLSLVVAEIGAIGIVVSERRDAALAWKIARCTIVLKRRQWHDRTNMLSGYESCPAQRRV